MKRLLCLVVVFLPLLLSGGDNMATITYEIVTADGVTFDLSTGVFKLYGLENIGMPGVRTYSHMVPGQPGAVLDDKLDEVRVVTVAQSVYGADAAAVFAAINDVAENYRYNRTTTLQPLRLRVTVDGTAADLYCYYGGMIINKMDNRHALFGFNLEAYDPYWYATTETDTKMQCIDSLAVSYILGKVDNVWTAMGNNGTGVVYAITADSNDNLYVGGNFDNWAGLGAGDAQGIVYWTKSTTTWSVLGTGGDDTWVNEINIGPDGNVYIGGTFTGMGGVGNTPGIAYWDGSAWQPMGTGVDDNYVAGLAIDSEGNVYAGGHFTGMGGVGNTPKIAMWDGAAWNAMLLGLDGIVYDIAVDASDNVYACGAFTDVAGGGGGTYNRIIKWDGSAWSALGTGLNGIAYDLAIDADGMVYVAGSFTTANGVTVNRVAKWNGQTFEAMDGGASGTVFHLDVAPNGDIYIAGVFATVGSAALDYPNVARWNGSSWRPVDFTLPSGIGSTLDFEWDSEENFYIGFDQTGEALVSKIADITHPGNVDMPPTTAISGPGTLVMIRNETTDVEMPFNFYINDGETITVDLGDPGEIPGDIGISTDWTSRPNANNLLGKSLSPAELGQFKLAGDPVAASGVNKVGIFVTGQPLEANDNNNQLSRYAGITGVATTNTDAGRMYVSIIDDGGGFYHIALYDDSARTSLVGHTATYNGTGSKAIVADGASGLGGTIYVDAVTAVDADITVDYALATISHWDRYDSLFAAVD